MVSCADENTESQNNATDKTYIIYDTNIGSSTDDLFALEIIYYFANQSDYELIGGIVCRMGDEYIKLADLMNTCYVLVIFPWVLSVMVWKTPMSIFLILALLTLKMLMVRRCSNGVLMTIRRFQTDGNSTASFWQVIPITRSIFILCYEHGKYSMAYFCLCKNTAMPVRFFAFGKIRAPY